MSKWRETTLNELADFRNGKGISSDLYTCHGKFPVMGANGQLARTDELLYTEPVVVIGRVGAYCGCIHRVKESSWVTDNAIVATPKLGVDFDFLYYRLKSLNLERTAIGSAQPLVTQGGLKLVRTSACTMDEQRAIASVLGTLDDKIELNRRMNETLEAMAQSLFKAWFVDATQDGLPKGWRESTIRELASNVQYGLTQSASTEPVGARFLRITDIQGGWVDWGSVPFCGVSPEEHERYRLKPGDVLVARTGASTGENIYIPVAPDAVFASYLVRFQFADPAIARMVGSFMRTPTYFDFVAGCVGGSAQPNASAQVLASAMVPVPPAELAKRFAETVAPLDQRIAANNEESRTLAALRDALLPRLLSGELRVAA